MAAPMALLPPRRSTLTVAPKELGDVLDAKQIRTEFFKDRVSIDWVLEHVAPEKKWYMGKVAVWYHGDVAAWMPSFVAAQRARRARGRRRKGED